MQHVPSSGSFAVSPAGGLLTDDIVEGILLGAKHLEISYGAQGEFEGCSVMSRMCRGKLLDYYC